MTRHSLDTPQFYLTSPSPCPYIEGNEERKVFTHLVGEHAVQVNDMLSQGGFRRSQNIAYRPACEGCKACVSVRVIANEFEPSKSFKRVISANKSLVGKRVSPEPTQEQFSLFRRYLDARHAEGGMAEMTGLDFAMMVEDTHVNTMMVEYRRRGTESAATGEGEGPLVAVALTDILSNGLSMVYSFFDTESEFKSLGSYLILDHIRIARKMGLPYLYLGYWVEQSPKMSYKMRFRPIEQLSVNGWVRHD